MQNLPHVGTELPKTWLKIRDILEKSQQNYIRYTDYLDTCDKHGIKLLKDKIQLSEFLHDLGVCLHFNNDPILKRLMILKPEWSTEAVYKVLDNPKVVINYGRFTKSDLSEIWADSQYSLVHDELIQLMINFQLCYEIPDEKDMYIAPQLLTLKQPIYKWSDDNNLSIRYKFDFMPKGVLSRFIVVMHKFILDNNIVWRNGIVLSRKNTYAEIIEQYEKGEISIRIRGKFKKELMTIICYEIDRINTSYHDLKYDKLIPCNCSSCIKSELPTFYQFDQLQDFISNRQFKIQCRNAPYQMVNVTKLIDDIFIDDKELFYSANLTKHREPNTAKNKVYISYAWGGESEKLADRLETTCLDSGINVYRDKKNILYKGLIQEFMKELGKSKCIIVIISDKYLKSENCMFELTEIAGNGSFYDRIFPIILKDAKIFKPIERIEYVKYWEKRIQELDVAIKSVSSVYLNGFREEIDLYVRM